MAELGETVLYHDPTHSSFAKRWIKGLWLGKVSSTDERIVGTAGGRVLSCSVARRPEEKRWSTALLAQVVCTPMDPRASLEPAAQAERSMYLYARHRGEARAHARLQSMCGTRRLAHTGVPPEA